MPFSPGNKVIKSLKKLKTKIVLDLQWLQKEQNLSIIYAIFSIKNKLIKIFF